MQTDQALQRVRRSRVKKTHYEPGDLVFRGNDGAKPVCRKEAAVSCAPPNTSGQQEIFEVLRVRAAMDDVQAIIDEDSFRQRRLSPWTRRTARTSSRSSSERMPGVPGKVFRDGEHGPWPGREPRAKTAMPRRSAPLSGDEREATEDRETTEGPRAKMAQSCSARSRRHGPAERSRWKARFRGPR